VRSLMTTSPRRGVAVVTGGSAGLGRAIVRELADRGWDVAVLARGQDGLDAAAADVRARAGRAHVVSVDIADSDAVERAASEVESELGPITLWINNVMSGTIGPFLDTTPEDFDRATRVTYLGAVNGTRAALHRMRERNRGHIIQIGSALAHRGIPLQAAYCGAKHALNGFTDSVVAELTHERSAIAVSSVDMPALNTTQFGWVKSPFPRHPQPVPPIYQPEIGARVVADVADRPRRRTWVGESTVGLVLGARFAGRFLDWYLAKNTWEGQFAADKAPSSISSNLYEPIPGDHGAHGAFDDRARGDSLQTWAIGHRRGLAAVGSALAATLAVGLASLLRRR
jgi:NAD(P)-dependent dehydrogenase (short-subunit alcohol dehydrogenase family)